MSDGSRRYRWSAQSDRTQGIWQYLELDAGGTEQLIEWRDVMTIAMRQVSSTCVRSTVRPGLQRFPCYGV